MECIWLSYSTSRNLNQSTSWGLQIDLSITNHVVMIWFAAIFLLLALGLSFEKDRLVPSGFAAMLEMLILFIRDEVAIPNLGEEDGSKFTPLIATFFFFRSYL